MKTKNNGSELAQWALLMALCAALALAFVWAFDKESAIQDTIRAERAAQADTISALFDK